MPATRPGSLWHICGTSGCVGNDDRRIPQHGCTQVRAPPRHQRPDKSSGERVYEWQVLRDGRRKRQGGSPTSTTLGWSRTLLCGSGARPAGRLSPYLALGQHERRRGALQGDRGVDDREVVSGGRGRYTAARQVKIPGGERGGRRSRHTSVALGVSWCRGSSRPGSPRQRLPFRAPPSACFVRRPAALLWARRRRVGGSARRSASPQLPRRTRADPWAY